MARLRVLVGLSVAVAALSLGSPAVADCGGPDITVSARRLSPGDDLTITGRGWGDACNDTPGPGCDPPPLGEPIEDIRLRLTSADASVGLATVDADDEYSIDVTLEVPEVPTGTYRVEAAGGGRRVVTPVRISSRGQA